MSLVAISLILSASLLGGAEQQDTLGRSFGVPTSDSLLQAGMFDIPGWRRIPIEWDSLYAYHRLLYRGGSDSVAGCVGDFDGDSCRDYAFLLKNRSTGQVLPYAFLGRVRGFALFPLQPVNARYGFDEDSTIAPGPFRVGKPSDYYVSVGSAPADSLLPTDRDYIQVGWRTYFWTHDGGFDSLWTAD